MKQFCTGRNWRHLIAVLSSALLGGWLSSDPALAQVSAASEQTSDKLQEVVVTAQKRTENLQNVPISAQVISSSDLAEQNQNSLNELTATLPGVTVSSGGFSNNLFIRGIGSGANNPSYDQSVSTFVDDIYFGRSRMSQGLFLDLDRIEVLKGPQSTFFGNNAIAGAFNIVTKKPTDQFDAWGRLLYGMFGQYAAEGAIGGPLTDALSVRLAVTRNGNDRGWIDNVNLDEEVPHVNNLAGRLTFFYHPSEAFDATLKVEASEHRNSGAWADQPGQWVNCPPPAPIRPTFAGVCAQAIAMGVPLGLNNDETSGLAGQGNSLSTFQSVLTLNYRRWGQTFTSVTGFYNYHFAANVDGAGGGLPVFIYLAQQNTEKYHQVSQEFRVASDIGGRVQYLAGVYFQSDELPQNITINAPFADFVAKIPGFGGLAPYLPVSFQPGFIQDEKVYSIFGSLSWNITDQWKVNAGLRGSRVDKDFNGYLNYGTSSQVFGGFTPIPPDLESLWGILEGPPGTTSESRSDEAWMPSAGIQYQIDPSAMAYFSYSRGFKAGGFNGLLPNKPLEDLEFGPEHVNAYELGIKSKWLNDTVLLNLDAFLSDYFGLQANTQVYNPATNTYSPLVRNAAESRSQGVELEAQWIITPELRLTTNITYLDSYYVSYPNATPTTLQTYCSGLTQAQYQASAQCHVYGFPVPKVNDLSGFPTPFSPRWSGSLTASYTLVLPRHYRFTTELIPFVTSGYYSSAGNTNDPLYHIGGYLRLDGRMTLETPDGHWAFDLVGKNLTDKVIPTNIGANTTFYYGSKEMPFNVALQARYKW
jgi:outer membrane receptor protein involved in Fe transport